MIHPAILSWDFPWRTYHCFNVIWK